MARPDLSTVPSFFHNYVNQVRQDDLHTAFAVESPAFIQFLEAIPVHKRDYRYAEGKWTIKELIQHIIDAERIFCYRALRFARKDTIPLPGFDENLYAQTAKAEKRNWEDLVEEFKTVRKASEFLFGSFDEEQLGQRGISSNNSISVSALGFVIIGHVNHHKNVMKERYLS